LDIRRAKRSVGPRWHVANAEPPATGSAMGRAGANTSGPLACSAGRLSRYILWMGDSPSDWEQYEQLVGLYRYYLELAVKTAAAFWIIAGGVLTLVLANSEADEIRWALSVPILMSIGVVAALLVGKPKAIELAHSIERLATKLDLEQRTHAELLVWTLWGMIGITTVAGLVIAFVWSAY